MVDISRNVNVNMICHNGINSSKVTLVVVSNMSNLPPTTFTMHISAIVPVVLGSVLVTVYGPPETRICGAKSGCDGVLVAGLAQ